MNWEPLNESNPPDSDVPVLVGHADKPGFGRLVLLEFTDDSEGHGRPYWIEADYSGHEYLFDDFTHWCPFEPPGRPDGKTG